MVESSMKEWKVAHRIAALMIVLGFVLFAILSPFGCQEPIQPSGLIIRSNVTVQVEDGNGDPIPDAIVEFAPVAQGLSGQLQSTDSRGIYRIADLEIPTNGAEYIFRVTAPPDDPEFGGAGQTRIIHLPCTDTLLQFVFVRTLPIECGQIGESRDISLIACIDSADEGHLSFTNTTGLPLDITFTMPGISDLSGGIQMNATPQTSPFNLPAGQSFSLDAFFNPTSENAGGSGVVVIEGRDPSGNLCYRITVRLTGTLRPCDAPGVGVCSVDFVNSSILFPPPNDTIRAHVDRVGSGTLCIENVGDGDLTVRSSQVLNSRLFRIEPRELTIPPGGRDCFIITFAPTSDSVWPGGRGSRPGRLRFFDSIHIEGCDTTFPIKGVTDTAFPAIINNCRTPYSYRSQHCGDRITDDDQIVTECEKDSTAFDWYVESADPVTRTGRMRSESAFPPFKSVRSNYIPSSSTGFSCSDPSLNATAAAACENPGGWTNTLNVSMGDVILFRKGGQCWMLFINSINDANVEGKPLICYDICRLK